LLVSGGLPDQASFEASPPSDDTDRVVPLVSVVIATHQRPERVARVLRALCDQTIGPNSFEVVAVDDCSGDETGDVLASLVGDLPYVLRPLRTQANRGPGPARNIGWRVARAPIVAFTDDDCMPEPGWLEAGLKALGFDRRLGVLQGKTGPLDVSALLQNRWNLAVNIDGPTPYFETCNIFYRKSALEDAGGFGEHYNWWGGWYCEDTFAGWRVIDAGWSRGYTPDARVVTDVERRSLKWWIKKSLVLYIEVEVARQHPGFRREAFWRSWSPRRHDAAFVLGSAGLLLALRHRWAAVLAIPYMAWRRPGIRYPYFARQCVETVAVDSARTVGILYGAVKHRVLVI
jgi:glycosyltransferase involved in cell wall biosynthesis